MAITAPAGYVYCRLVITESLGHQSIDWPSAETVVFCGVYMFTMKFTALYTLPCSKYCDIAMNQLPLV